MTVAIIASDRTRSGLLRIAAAGLLSGLVTPLLPTLIDKLIRAPGDFRIALVAAPFAILIGILVRRFTPNP